MCKKYRLKLWIISISTDFLLRRGGFLPKIIYSVGIITDRASLIG